MFLLTNLFKKFDKRFSNRNVKLFSFLLISTILAHLFALFISELTDGSIWTYSERFVQQKQLFSLGFDGGYFEHYQYIILLWCALLSLLITIRQSKKVFNIFIIYSFLFIDDALSFHDRAYGKIISIFSNTLLFQSDFLRTKDFAEIIFWLIVFVFCILISLRSFLSRNKKVKQFVSINFNFFILLAFFSKFIDILVSNIEVWLNALGSNSIFISNLKQILYYVEEIGEIFVLSLICLWLFEVASTNTISSIKN